MVKKVIVVTRREYYPSEVILTKNLGSFTITVSDDVYEHYDTIIGVFSTADGARKAIEDEKKRILQLYGEKALSDDEEGTYIHYMFSTGTYDVEEGEINEQTTD